MPCSKLRTWRMSQFISADLDVELTRRCYAHLDAAARPDEVGFRNPD